VKYKISEKKFIKERDNNLNNWWFDAKCCCATRWFFGDINWQLREQRR